MMKMLKNKALFWIVSCFVCFAFKANAQLKIDALAIGGKIVTAVETKVGEIQQKAETAIKKLQQSTIGTKIKTRYETLMALKEDIQSKADQAKKLYDDTQEKIEQGQEIYQTYEEKLKELENSEVATTAELKGQISDVEQQMADRKNVLFAEQNAKLQAANDNITILQDMINNETDETVKAQLESDLQKAQDYKAEMQNNLENLEDPNSGFLNADEEYAALNDEKTQLTEQYNNQLESLKAAALAGGASALSRMITKSIEAMKSGYRETMNKNFAAEDTPVSDKLAQKLEDERERVYLNDMAHALTTAMKLRNKIDELEKESDKIANNVEAVDASNSAVRLSNQQRIQHIQDLDRLVELKFAELRFKTAQDVFDMDYRLNMQQTEPGVKDFDAGLYEGAKTDADIQVSF